jgi:proteasome assembly chaperone (PAC2) family protein
MPETPAPYLTYSAHPRLTDGTLLLALGGWMDGGLVSTGTVQRLMDNRPTLEVARVDSDPFYIYNFPGPMDVAAVFRPAVKYDDGMITELQLPENIFSADIAANLLFFTGQEPNLRWQSFADCVFAVAAEVGVKRIIFIGSFGGAVPHTREPRLYGSVSHESLKPLLREHEVRLSDYEGPSGFSTLLLAQSAQHNLEMFSLVAEVPGYLEGLNPLSIQAVTRRLARMLNQSVDLDQLRQASTGWELQVSEAVEKDAELAETVRKLEERYDNELIEGNAEE